MKKIVITGGPSAGKSELMHFAECELAKCGYKVFGVPETASELISGAHLSATDERYSFQKAILKLQLSKEDIIEEAISGYNSVWNGGNEEKTVILCDRGALDGKAYMPENDWDKMLCELNLSEEDLVNRYDGVIFLETISKYDTNLFSDETNKARKEKPFDAIDLDNRTHNAWKLRKDMCVIKAVGNFENKKAEFLNELQSIINR